MGGVQADSNPFGLSLSKPRPSSGEDGPFDKLRASGK